MSNKEFNYPGQTYELDSSRQNRTLTNSLDLWIKRARFEEARNAKLVMVLMEIDHTLVVHGHIDKDTALHERVRDAFQQSTEKP